MKMKMLSWQLRIVVWFYFDFYLLMYLYPTFSYNHSQCLEKTKKNKNKSPFWNGGALQRNGGNRSSASGEFGTSCFLHLSPVVKREVILDRICGSPRRPACPCQRNETRKLFAKWRNALCCDASPFTGAPAKRNKMAAHRRKGKLTLSRCISSFTAIWKLSRHVDVYICLLWFRTASYGTWNEPALEKVS